MTVHNQQLFFELVRISLGTADGFCHNPSAEEWHEIYNEANRQALAGVLMEGVKRLPAEQRPPRQLLLDWHSTSELIASQNRQTNHDCVWVSQRWTRLGYHNIILKGQGNALLYPNPLSRKPGDIDILIDAPRKKVIDYARRLFPHEEITRIEMNFPVLKTTPVEIHFKATYLYNPFTDRIICRYIEQQLPHTQKVKLHDGEIEIPGLEMNIVFQLSHIYRHLFFEGIGLRQLVDMYYLLHSEGVRDTFPHVREIINKVKLAKFTKGLMWILHDVFGMPDSMAILPPDEKEGRFLLNEIMKAGNFGQGDDRVGNWLEMNRWERLTWGMNWALRLIGHYPAEVMWHPIYRIRQYIWRRWNNYL